MTPGVRRVNAGQDRSVIPWPAKETAVRLTLEILLVLSFSACGSSAPVQRTASAPVRPVAAAPAPAPIARAGSITRAELDAIVDGGLGRFLQAVEFEPMVDDGHFVGHRVIEVRDPRLAGVDLRTGDTIVRVNGQPIERPEQALRVFEGLRVASELVIEYLRPAEQAGPAESRELRFAIVE